MKQLLTIHKDLVYEFVLYERTRTIQVYKDNLQSQASTYSITPKGDSWNCDCPSGFHRGRCWHKNMVSMLIEQPSIEEPWVEWAEEAEEMRREMKL